MTKHNQTLYQLYLDGKLGNPKPMMNTDKTTDTKASETPDKFRAKGFDQPKYTLDDCGCYVDFCESGIYAIDKIVSFAEAHGMTSQEVPKHDQHTVFPSRFASYEFSSEIEDEADDYMNAQYAVEGAYWGRSEQGDWGLWQIDDSGNAPSVDLELRVGTRIRLMRDVERFPFFIVRKGATGTVTSWDRNGIAVKMDEKLESCEEWDNNILWDNDEESFAQFCDDIQMIA